MKLKTGDKAPAIQAVDHNGNKVSLEDYKGSKVILYFYPKDDTPGCTAEACNLRDNFHLLLEKGFKIIGVSADSASSHLKFAGKYALPFPLIPDTEKKILQDYGVWGKKKFMGREYDGINRMTFVISEDGTILKIFDKVQTKDHADQILSEFK
ncbi:MAG: thioredoxin-dependent thiol peroxidase [Bacteroidales bacterium]|nr:thioredoxin-dependent thiol peroxidase [Bacteroidales bacterium]